MNILRHGYKVLRNSPLLALTFALSLGFLGLFLVQIGYYVAQDLLSIDHILRPLIGCVSALGLGYGLARVMAFHPIFDEEYRQWLATTPWTPRHPLPKGPLHLISFDWLFVGCLVVLATIMTLFTETPQWLFVLGPLLAFALGLAGAWTLANWGIADSRFPYCTLAVPIVLAAPPIPVEFFALAPPLMAWIAWLGVKDSLEKFPWRGASSKAVWPTKIVGWPFAALLRPVKDEIRTTELRALAEALGAAICIVVVSRFIDESDPSEAASGVSVIAGLGGMLGALAKATPSFQVVCADFCWGQRVATGRWLVPKHDQIFVAPFLMLLVGFTMPWITMNLFGFSATLAFATATALLIFIARGMGPDIEELHYTGVHRMSGSLGPSKDFSTTRGDKV